MKKETTMQYTTPEKMGIRSENILDFLKFIEETHLPIHNVIIMRHGEIVFENYWKPFHKDTLHRMYSVTKSFVSLAMGFLEQDGMIDLDAPISEYFPEESKYADTEYMKKQTIRQMLKMSTAKPFIDWFTARTDDRVRLYFQNDRTESRPAGTIFDYDSHGSFVMGSLIERITGKELLTYLREKFLDRIGFSKEAYMLKCPGGHSWSDSALVCKPSDLLKTAMFVMNGGVIDGEQVLNAEYIKKATGKQVETQLAEWKYADGFGYGYQFWRTLDNSYFMNGMGSQYAVNIPDKDMIFVINGDTQGNASACDLIMSNFFNMIVRKAADESLPEDADAQKALADYADSLSLFAVKGAKTSPWADRINGKEFEMNKNPMGISKLRIEFAENSGKLFYTNEQGDKEITFGLSENAFCDFPQDGYSGLVGSEKGDSRYPCAASAYWFENQLMIKVQIIGEYLGNLNITIGFTSDDEVGVFMIKSAEDFLNEYQGFAGGKMIK